MAEYNQALSGLGEFISQLLLRNKEMNRRRGLFDQFNQGTIETVYKPQGETTYGKPEGIGVRYPTTLPTVQPVQQGVPLDSPQFLNAAMQFLGGGGSQPDLNTLIQLRQLGQGQFKEIPAGSTYGTVTGGRFTPQGTTEFKPSIQSQAPPYQFGSPVTTERGELQIPVGNKKTGEAKLVPTNEKALPKPIPIPKSKAELTSATRTMLEMAPTVKYFVEKIKGEVANQEKTLGAAQSRWREFKAGKVGFSDPAFTEIRTNVGLLTTALMRMHVGARGGEYIMKHFQSMIAEGKQSPENLQSALDQINDYADQLISEKGQASTGSVPGQTTSKFKILKKE